MQAGTRGLEIHCAGLIAALFTAFLSVSAPGLAAPTDGPVRKGDAGGGALLFRGDQPGLYVPAPILATKVEIDVSGTIARTTVTQYFRNPSDRWVEATRSACTATLRRPRVSASRTAPAWGPTSTSTTYSVRSTASRTPLIARVPTSRALSRLLIVPI